MISEEEEGFLSLELPCRFGPRRSDRELPFDSSNPFLESEALLFLCRRSPSFRLLDFESRYHLLSMYL